MLLPGRKEIITIKGEAVPVNRRRYAAPAIVRHLDVSGGDALLQSECFGRQIMPEEPLGSIYHRDRNQTGCRQAGMGNQGLANPAMRLDPWYPIMEGSRDLIYR